MGLSSGLFGQISSISFSTAAGYTIVNLEDAVGVDQLEDWDNLGLMFKAGLAYRLKDNLLLVGEVGSNRLYYWEYYWNDGYYDGYRLGPDWTSSVGIHMKLYLSGPLFLQFGLGAYFYGEGAGVVPGDVLQLGYEIPLAGSFSLPVIFRVENVMGNGFPISLMLGSGISFNFTR